MWFVLAALTRRIGLRPVCQKRGGKQRGAGKKQ